NVGAEAGKGLAGVLGRHMPPEGVGLALELAAEPAEIAEDVGSETGLAARLCAQRIAGLERNRAGDVLAARLQGLGDLEQHPAALARRGLAPSAIGQARPRGRTLHTPGVAARHRGAPPALGPGVRRGAP